MSASCAACSQGRQARTWRRKRGHELLRPAALWLGLARHGTRKQMQRKRCRQHSRILAYDLRRRGGSPRRSVEAEDELAIARLAGQHAVAIRVHNLRHTASP